MAKRTDANQKEIVAALRKAGATVESLHRVGKGVPDLLIGYRERNYLIECKTDKGNLTPQQVDWHGSWNGEVFVARDPMDALRAIGAIK